MHSTGSMYSCGTSSKPGRASSYVVFFLGWMQSTGQASTQAVSFTPMQGSAMTYAMVHLLPPRYPSPRRDSSAAAVLPHARSGWAEASDFSGDLGDKFCGLLRAAAAFYVAKPPRRAACDKASL